MTYTTIEDALRAYREAKQLLAQTEHDLRLAAREKFGPIVGHMTPHEIAQVTARMQNVE